MDLKELKFRLFTVEENAALEAALEESISMTSKRILGGMAKDDDVERLRAALSLLKKLDPESNYLRHFIISRKQPEHLSG